MGASKAKGTRAETALREWLNNNGWPAARRQALAGAKDTGDVWVSENMVVEVKAGRMAERASAAAIEQWMNEALVEASQAGTRFGILVKKRPGVGTNRIHLWDAFTTVNDLVSMTGGRRVNVSSGLVMLSVQTMFEVLKNYEKVLKLSV